MIDAETLRSAINNASRDEEGRIVPPACIVFSGRETEAYHKPVKGILCDIPSYNFANTDLERLNARYKDALRELQTRLARYTWRPTVSDRLYTALGVSYLWQRSSPAVIQENTVLQFLLEQLHSPAGFAQVLRYKRCSECFKWLYAIKSTKRYCSDDCRKRYSSHSAEFKKKRSAYMRLNYRPKERERDQRARELASRGTEMG